MTPERWQQVERLYESALRHEETDRTAFLEAACAGDRDLRREVESLLAYPDPDGGFMGGPALELAARTLAEEPAESLVGRLLGSYEIVALLGAGGMGEVYRARDGKLEREVALKVLPEAFAQDPERVARFRREALLLASLNHANIAVIHGLEDSGGVRFLVLELVPGETLAERIAAGPLGVQEALRICAQVAEALEAAHDKGIIHRDLKPANIKITPEGKVKVLDFGLAKALAGAGSGSSHSPSATEGDSGDGAILGTAAYMSPEQARGKPVDRRTDILAFGCVLYEALTGRRAFAGETVSDTIACVLERQPDWEALPASTPASIRLLLRRCLEKNGTRRLHDIADARIEIEDALAGREGFPDSRSSSAATPAVVRAAAASRRRERLAWMVACGIVAAVAGFAVWILRSPQPEPVARLLIGVTPADDLAADNADRPSRTAIAVSPDGRHIVFSAKRGGTRQLYLRALDRLDASPIPGTERGEAPFFSPDGHRIGFWTAAVRGSGSPAELKKVSLDGRPPVTLCNERRALFGASWASNDSIVFGTFRDGLWRVPASGGAPQALTTVGKGEFSHRLPHVLPGGNAVLFTITKALYRWEDAQIVVRSLVTGKQRVLFEGGADARYVPTGHIVYARMGTLMAVPFDLTRLQVTGGAIALVPDVMQAINRDNSNRDQGAAQFSISDSGALLYLPGGIQPDHKYSLVYVDRNGAVEPVLRDQRPYFAPRLSPDRRHLAFSIYGITQGLTQPVWMHDIRRGVTTRITFEGKKDDWPIWMPDSKHVTFASDVGPGAINLFRKPADGSLRAERLTTGEGFDTPSSWSPDGSTLAFVRQAPNPDIWVMSLGKESPQSRPFLATSSTEQYPEFSPDGRWLAYVSNESGRDQVYVQAYPGPGAPEQVSTDGGKQPAWGHNGRELFYTVGSIDNAGTWNLKMMSVDVTTIPTFTAAMPRTLFTGPYEQTFPVRDYDVTPDGRFLMVDVSTDQPPPPVTHMVLVLNWLDELKRRAGAGSK